MCERTNPCPKIRTWGAGCVTAPQFEETYGMAEAVLLRRASPFGFAGHCLEVGIGGGGDGVEGGAVEAGAAALGGVDDAGDEAGDGVAECDDDEHDV